jgi:DNA-binding transcriptional LysR family regulator
MFDLTRLRLLRELAHRGTMTAVAEALGLTSSAVSQQLAVLEREARTQLLERVGRRVRLTSEGERLAVHAETILQAVEAAALDLRTARDAPAGVLEVAAFATFAKARLLPAVIRALARHPGLDIVLHELEPRESIEAVRDGRCDLAISFAYNLAPRPQVGGLSSRFLMEEPVLLALPPRWADAPDPLDLGRLADAEWIVGSRQGDDRRLAEHACAMAGFAPRMTHGVGDYDLQLEMIAAGLGVGFIPTLGLQFPSAERVVVRTAAGPPITRRIEAVTRGAMAASPRVDALLAELATQA